MKWKLETHKHFLNRRTTGTQLCALLRGLPLSPKLELALQKFTSEDFLLRNLQWNYFSLFKQTRKPNQVSEEVLVSLRFSQINTLLII